MRYTNSNLSQDESTYGQDAQDFLKGPIDTAIGLLKLEEYTGRKEPDVKTQMY